MAVESNEANAQMNLPNRNRARSLLLPNFHLLTSQPRLRFPRSLGLVGTRAVTFRHTPKPLP